MRADTYDKLFLLYSIFLLGSIGVFIYAAILRYSFTSQVCCGDFILKPEEADDSAWQAKEDNYYLKGSGRLLQYYVVIESIFVACCVSQGVIWSLVTPESIQRLIKPVGAIQTEQYQALVEDRLQKKK